MDDIPGLTIDLAFGAGLLTFADLVLDVVEATGLAVLWRATKEEDEEDCGIFLGGVEGVLSKVFEEDDCVGRIMRARKLSSTLLSVFLGSVCPSLAAGGGPILGLDGLVVDCCFVTVLAALEAVETLVRL